MNSEIYLLYSCDLHRTYESMTPTSLVGAACGYERLADLIAQEIDEHDGSEVAEGYTTYADFLRAHYGLDLDRMGTADLVGAALDQKLPYLHVERVEAA